LQSAWSAFDPPASRRAYVELNQARYHPFTADNQDYLAYACLMLGAGISTLDKICSRHRRGACHTQELMVR